MRKPIIYWSPDFYLGPETPDDYDKSRERAIRKRYFFKKYFPKYIKTISLDLNNGPLRSKLKRTKVIQNLQYPYSDHHRAYWRTIFANKTKTIKTVFSNQQSPYQFAQKIKIFSGLKNLSIIMPSQIGHAPAIEKIENEQFKTSFAKLKRLICLKSLVINYLAKDHKNLLEKLNSFSQLLSPLKTFHLICDEVKTTDPELLHLIQNQKYIINSVTSLDLGALCTPSHHVSFKGLAGSCPKLQQLRLEISNRNVVNTMFGYQKFAEKTFPVEVNYLASLGTFHNLKTLHLKIDDTYTCLKDLTLPLLIQDLVLNFKECLSKEIILKIEPTFFEKGSEIFKRFEENETFLQFYERFQSLNHLESLNIDFNVESDSESYQHQSYLLNSLLKRVPTLRKFSSGLSNRCEGLNTNRLNTRITSDFPRLFESCHHFSQALQTLKLGHEKITISSLDFSASQGKFSQLSSIEIIGGLEEESQGLNPPILPFLQGIISLGASLTKIKILFFIGNNVKSLLSVLRQLSEFKMPAEVYLEMEVKFVELQDLEDLKAGFNKVISELASNEQRSWKAKRTSLKVFTTKKSEGMKRFLEVFGERFEQFEVCPKTYYYY